MFRRSSLGPTSIRRGYVRFCSGNAVGAAPPKKGSQGETNKIEKEMNAPLVFDDVSDEKKLKRHGTQFVNASLWLVKNWGVADDDRKAVVKVWKETKVLGLASIAGFVGGFLLLVRGAIEYGEWFYAYLVDKERQREQEIIEVAGAIAQNDYGPEKSLEFEDRFKDPELEMQTLVELSRRKNTVAILGPKCIGKTALLQHLHRYTGSDLPVVYLSNVHPAANLERELYMRLRRPHQIIVKRAEGEERAEYLKSVVEAVKSAKKGEPTPSERKVQKDPSDIQLQHAFVVAIDVKRPVDENGQPIQAMSKFQVEARELAEQLGICVVFTTSDAQAVLTLKPEDRDALFVLHELSTDISLKYAKSVLEKSSIEADDIEIETALSAFPHRNFVAIKDEIGRLVKDKKRREETYREFRDITVPNLIEKNCRNPSRFVEAMNAHHGELRSARIDKECFKDGVPFVTEHAADALLRANILRPAKSGEFDPKRHQELLAWHSDLVKRCTK